MLASYVAIHCFSKVLGNMYRKQGDVRSADQAFFRAQASSATRKVLHLVTISLVSIMPITTMCCRLTRLEDIWQGL